jgi:AcrR family transcriptional regulator
MEAPNRCWDGRRTSMQDQGSAAAKSTNDVARQRRRSRERDQLLEAMLAVSGEVGYTDATVRRVVARSGGSVVGFYRHFRDRADCFAAAHQAEAERLLDALRAAAAEQPSWRESLRADLTALFDYAAERPLQARAILNEVYVAGGDALVQHQQVLERLSHAVDSARREIPSRQAPPPVTGIFMVSAIEGSVRYRLLTGEPQRLRDELPVLMHLVVGPYLGDEAAREELLRPPPER